jgi:hypothetical protein
MSLTGLTVDRFVRTTVTLRRRSDSRDVLDSIEPVSRISDWRDRGRLRFVTSGWEIGVEDESKTSVVPAWSLARLCVQQRTRRYGIPGIRGKGRHCAICKLQSLKSPIGFESHPLRFHVNRSQSGCCVAGECRIVLVAFPGAATWVGFPLRWLSLREHKFSTRPPRHGRSGAIRVLLGNIHGLFRPLLDADASRIETVLPLSAIGISSARASM